MAPGLALLPAAASNRSMATVQAAAPWPAARMMSSLVQAASAAELAADEHECEQQELTTSQQQLQQQQWQQQRRQQPTARPPAPDLEPGGKGVGGSPPCVRALPRHCWQCSSIQPADPASEYFEVFGL